MYCVVALVNSDISFLHAGKDVASTVVYTFELFILARCESKLCDSKVGKTKLSGLCYFIPTRKFEKRF